MLPDGSLPILIGMLICLAFSAFFSSSETAFTSYNRNKMKLLAQDGNKKAARALKMSEDYDWLLSTILVGNNIVNIALSSMATLWFVDLFVLNLRNSSAESIGSVVATATITVLVLIFGEITPKSIAKDHPEGFAMGVSGLLRFISIVLTPINFIFMLWRKLVKKVFKPDVDEGVTEGEVLTLVDEAHEGGSIDEYNKEIIENIFEFDDITAGEIATHRTDLTMLAIDGTHEEWADIINNSRFSRYPVYGESVDDILGILDARTYFRLEDKSRESVMKTAMQDAYFVPETVKADVLFKNMKANKQYFSVVLDEYGGTLGIVTMEDILEELVGEIWDESDEIVNDCVKTGNNTYEVSGDMNIEDFFAEIEFEPKDFECEYSTMGGWAIEMLNADPHVGDNFTFSNYNEEEESDDDYEGYTEIYVIVSGMDDMRITKLTVLVRKVEPEEKDKNEQ